MANIWCTFDSGFSSFQFILHIFAWWVSMFNLLKGINFIPESLGLLLTCLRRQTSAPATVLPRLLKCISYSLTLCSYIFLYQRSLRSQTCVLSPFEVQLKPHPLLKACLCDGSLWICKAQHCPPPPHTWHSYFSLLSFMKMKVLLFHKTIWQEL